MIQQKEGTFRNIKSKMKKKECFNKFFKYKTKLHISFKC